MKHEAAAKRGPSDADVNRGMAYFNGDLNTTPVEAPFRPSRFDDVIFVPDMPYERQVFYAMVALLETVKGTGVYNVLAAGASSRMNPKEAGRMKGTVEDLLMKMYGHYKELDSKGAVPLTQIDGVVYTFLGVFFHNVARFEQQAAQWAGGHWTPNRVRVMTNKDYVQELHAELARQQNYGYTGDIREFNQPLGFQYYARPSDVLKAKGLHEDRRALALQKSKEVENRLSTDPSAVVAKDELTPIGHGEFFHQLIVSNELLWDFEHGITWESVRNIDNTAGKFDWEWLVTLGLFLHRDLDFQGEVCPRVPGMKGGALISTEEGHRWFTEAASFETTWQASVQEEERQGFMVVPAEAAEAYIRSTWPPDQTLKLSPYRMDFAPLEATYNSIDDFIKEVNPKTSEGKLGLVKIFLFRNNQSGETRWLRRIFPEDTYWFNDAVGVFRPTFVYYLYRRDSQQTLEEFIEELRAARQNLPARKAIAHRGRVRFPNLMDPKPAKKEAAVLMKIETNMWESTRVAGPEARVDAVGVRSIANLDRSAFDQMTDVAQMAATTALRFLAVKEWDTGGAETYENVLPLIEMIVKYVHEANLLGLEIPSFQQAQALIRESIFSRPRTDRHLTPAA